MENWTRVGATAAVGLATAIGLRRYFRGGVCRSDTRMDGKTVVITGCNTGIGKETVIDLARRGARVAMACRDMERARAAAEDVKKQVSNADLVIYKCDLASLASVRECAAEINTKEERIDILLNNAGVMMCPHTKTEDGFEMQIGTNHFGHFLFTNLLLDKIKKSAPSRIVTVSSLAHERGKMDLEDIHFERRPYGREEAYKQSKLANILFTRELGKRLAGTGVTTYALHPGVVDTELGRHIQDKLVSMGLGLLLYPLYALVYFFMKTSKDGAQTNIYCCVAEDCADETGLYYSDCAKKDPRPQARDDDVAKRLWEMSATAVKL